MPRTGRQIVMERAKTRRLLSRQRVICKRAAMFLEGAHEVRAGCTNQRAQARRAQSTAWQKKVDTPVAW